MKSSFFIGLLLLGITLSGFAQFTVNENKPERVEWFKDLGFGMFIHWSLDAQLGSVISHSMVGASDEYLDRFVHELPESFTAENFNPEQWAKMAKMAGMQYVVFTAKHHSGFCMYATETTDFNVMNTPFGTDATKEVLDAFREEGLAVGLYFSPDDFHFLYQQGHPITRTGKEAQPIHNEPLMQHTKAQLEELLTNYGKIDMIFIDGLGEFEWVNTELAAYCWELDPDILVTRGAMETPEQEIPGEPIPGPWEACFTMGTQWQYKPTNENYKSGTTLINMLIETRAKGGNLLLNIGPKPDGTLPVEQENFLREMALWQFVNRESMQDVKPWHVTREDNIWFLQSEDENTVYAFITGYPDWQLGDRKSFLLKSVQGNASTTINVLGHAGKTLEYNPERNVTPRVSNTDQGLLISVTRSQRIYNNREWPNPVVVEIEGVEPREMEE